MIIIKMSAYLSNLRFRMPHLINYKYCVQRFTFVQYHTVREYGSWTCTCR